MKTNAQPEGNQSALYRPGRSSRPGLYLCWLALLLLAASGTARAATIKVAVGHDEFVPSDITIRAGDTVEWTWTTDHISSVTSGNIRKPDGIFDSRIQLAPYTFSFTFQNPGDFPYHCQVEPDNMNGVVHVFSATAAPGTLGNISTRLRVEAGDNVLIAGFIITGTQPKKVIIRAIGTSLPFADKLADPTLELHGPSGLIDSNNNWVDSPNKQAIMDSTIPPSSNLESAIVATLPANNTSYTAIVRGVNGGTGIGLVEAYDLDTTVNSTLANISTRGLVGTSDNVLIAGTIVLGEAPRKVIVRAIGPSLNIAGKLADPTLELYDANGVLFRANNDWRTGAQEMEIMATTIAPTNDSEAAIVTTLSGKGASYTAIVRGARNTTGIAVVEMYALD